MADPHEEVGPNNADDIQPKADSAQGTERSEIERLQTELADAQDRVLRTQAEMENFRRRTRRDREDERKFASQSLLVDLLPVLDNIERAIDAADQAGDGSGLLQGFQMVHHLLLEVLQRHDCPRIGAVGDLFNPIVHEAIAEEPSDEYDKGVVTRVNLYGYKLHDRVIRPAQVVVSAGPAAES